MKLNKFISLTTLYLSSIRVVSAAETILPPFGSINSKETDISRGCCTRPAFRYGRGRTGPTGPTGPAGVFSASYGQLSVSSQDVAMETGDTWVPIPFDSTGPSSNMGVSTTSPATITVQQAGVYQMNVSLYFSVEDSPEGTFDQTTYRLGVSINGGAVEASAAVFAYRPGQLSLNYDTIMDLSVNDYVQFYLEPSVAGGPTFTNIFTLESGNANLIQISS